MRCKPGHIAELAFERTGHRHRHHVRAGAGIERRYLDRRIIDLGQRRERQEAVADQPGEQDRDHQQRRRDRPQDEGSRRVGTFGRRREVLRRSRRCRRRRLDCVAVRIADALRRCTAFAAAAFTGWRASSPGSDPRAVVDPSAPSVITVSPSFTPGQDRDLAADRWTGLDHAAAWPCGRASAGRRNRPARHGGPRHRDRHRAVQRVDQHEHIDELVGEQPCRPRWRSAPWPSPCRWSRRSDCRR